MNHNNDIDDVKTKRICFECVGEEYLSDEIKNNGMIAQCSYCEQTAESYSIEEMAERVETAFDHHYYLTSDQPNSWQSSMLADRESDYIWDRDGVPILEAIENAVEITQEAAEDILAVLDDAHYDFEAAKMGEETEFSSDSYYEVRGQTDQAWQEEWSSFERSLKTEARFFSRTAAAHLALVFGGINKLKTADGKPLVLDAGPQLELDHLYRARVFQSEGKLKESLCRPDLHLCSPPINLASAGRMNAQGISVFYGSTEADVAIAEVRPPVGSNVTVAKFSIIRQLRLLDLTALKDVRDGGSFFDPSLKERLERVAFLQSLGERITRPVMPDDESFDYLPTQAIADFLATENDPPIDGIISRSSQSKSGRNVVLFQKAARVETIDVLDDMQFDVNTGYTTEEGFEPSYVVFEHVPPQTPTASAITDHDNVGLFSFSDRLYDTDCDIRESTLRIDLGSMQIHQVDWVKYNHTTYQVNRHRYESRDLSF